MCFCSFFLCNGSMSSNASASPSFVVLTAMALVLAHAFGGWDSRSNQVFKQNRRRRRRRTSGGQDESDTTSSSDEMRTGSCWWWWCDCSVFHQQTCAMTWSKKDDDTVRVKKKRAASLFLAFFSSFWPGGGSGGEEEEQNMFSFRSSSSFDDKVMTLLNKKEKNERGNKPTFSFFFHDERFPANKKKKRRKNRNNPAWLGSKSKEEGRKKTTTRHKIYCRLFSLKKKKRLEETWTCCSTQQRWIRNKNNALFTGCSFIIIDTFLSTIRKKEPENQKKCWRCARRCHTTIVFFAHIHAHTQKDCRSRACFWQLIFMRWLSALSFSCLWCRVPGRRWRKKKCVCVCVQLWALVFTHGLTLRKKGRKGRSRIPVWDLTHSSVAAAAETGNILHEKEHGRREKEKKDPIPGLFFSSSSDQNQKQHILGRKARKKEGRGGEKKTICFLNYTDNRSDWKSKNDSYPPPSLFFLHVIVVNRSRCCCCSVALPKKERKNQQEGKRKKEKNEENSSTTHSVTHGKVKKAHIGPCWRSQLPVEQLEKARTLHWLWLVLLMPKEIIIIIILVLVLSRQQAASCCVSPPLLLPSHLFCLFPSSFFFPPSTTSNTIIVLLTHHHVIMIPTPSVMLRVTDETNEWMNGWTKRKTREGKNEASYY